MATNDNARRLREAMLPGAVLDFCDRETPKLLQRHDRLSAQLDRIISEIEENMREMPHILTEDPERREKLMDAMLLTERAVSASEKLVKTHAALTGGGAAAVFVMGQKLFQPQPELAEERSVNIRRPLGCKAPVIEA